MLLITSRILIHHCFMILKILHTKVAAYLSATYKKLKIFFYMRNLYPCCSINKFLIGLLFCFDSRRWISFDTNSYNLCLQKLTWDISYYILTWDISYYILTWDISYYILTWDISYYILTWDISYCILTWDISYCILILI